MSATKVNLKNLDIDFSVNSHLVIMTGTAKERFFFIAPKPCDKRLSYNGSGLPYANEEMAFDNTPTKGEIKPGNFKLTFEMPSAHYEFCSERLLKPYIKFYNNLESHHVILGEPLIPNRSLVDLPNSPWHSRTTYGGNGNGGLN